MCPVTRQSNGHLVGEWQCIVDHKAMPDSGHVFVFRYPQTAPVESFLIGFIDGAIIGVLVYAMAKAVLAITESE